MQKENKFRVLKEQQEDQCGLSEMVVDDLGEVVRDQITQSSHC